MMDFVCQCQSAVLAGVQFVGNRSRTRESFAGRQLPADKKTVRPFEISLQSQRKTCTCCLPGTRRKQAPKARCHQLEIFLPRIESAPCYRFSCRRLVETPIERRVSEGMRADS